MDTNLTLKDFLDIFKNSQDLKVVLSLKINKGMLSNYTEIARYFLNDVNEETKRLLEPEIERLLSKAKSTSSKLDNNKEELWNNLTQDQQAKLGEFLMEASNAESMDKLEEVVNGAINSGIRLNYFISLDKEVDEYAYAFTDYVVKRISELKKNSKIASNIVCKLISKGAVFYERSSMYAIKELEEFKDHKANMKQACLDHQRCTLKFMEIAKSAASGRLKDARMDASTFYLRYSKDRTVKPAEIANGARDLGLIHGETGYGSNIIKIGKSEVEIITENGIRNYTNLADGSNIILTFYTTQGELDVRLYTDEKNKDLIKVEVQDQDKWKKLKNCNGEIGKNCLLGGLSVNKAIEQGSFTKHGELVRSEVMRPSKEVPETAVDNVSTTKYSKKYVARDKVPVA